MAVKPIISIDMDVAAFDKFRESFTQFEEQVKRVRVETKATGAGFAGVSATTSRAWANLARDSKSVAGNILGATRALLRWAEIGGIVSGLLGVGGLWGIDRLAIAAGNQRRSALGLGITPGEQRGFAATYGRLSDPGQFLSGVNAALHDVTQRVGLYGAGLTEGDLRGKDTGQVAALLVPALKRLADATPESMMAQVLKARHLDQFVTLEDFERYKHTPAAEIAGYQKEYQDRRRKLELNDTELKAWQNLQVQLHFAGMSIETTLIRGLTPLTPQLTQLSKAFTGVFEAFVNSPALKEWLGDVADGMKSLATWIATPQFKSSVEDVARGFVNVARAIGYLVEWIYSKFPSLNPGGGSVGGLSAPLGKWDSWGTAGHANDDWAWRMPGNKEPSQSKPWRWPGHDFLNRPYPSQTPDPMFGPGGAGPVSFSTGGTVTDSLLYGVEGAESAHGRDLRTSRAGAMGWMQITPDAWHDYATGGQTNPWDRKQAWEVARNELNHYMKMFNGDIPLSLASYNWGPAHVLRALKTYGSAWRQHLPKETSDYLKKILGDGGVTQSADAYQQKFRNSTTRVDVRNNTGGNATVTAAQLATG